MDDLVYMTYGIAPDDHTLIPGGGAPTGGFVPSANGVAARGDEPDHALAGPVGRFHPWHSPLPWLAAMAIGGIIVLNSKGD